MSNRHNTDVNHSLRVLRRRGGSESISRAAAQGGDPMANECNALFSTAVDVHAECVKPTKVLGGSDVEAWMSSFEEWSSASGLPAHVVRDGIFAIQTNVGADSLVVNGVDFAGAWLARVESKEVAEASRTPRQAAPRRPFA